MTAKESRGSSSIAHVHLGEGCMRGGGGGGGDLPACQCRGYLHVCLCCILRYICLCACPALAIRARGMQAHTSPRTHIATAVCSIHTSAHACFPVARQTPIAVADALRGAVCMQILLYCRLVVGTVVLCSFCTARGSASKAVHFEKSSRDAL